MLPFRLSDRLRRAMLSWVSRSLFFFLLEHANPWTAEMYFLLFGCFFAILELTLAVFSCLLPRFSVLSHTRPHCIFLYALTNLKIGFIAQG
jgi:hypothetical protein